MLDRKYSRHRRELEPVSTFLFCYCGFPRFSCFWELLRVIDVGTNGAIFRIANIIIIRAGPAIEQIFIRSAFLHSFDHIVTPNFAP